MECISRNFIDFPPIIPESRVVDQALLRNYAITLITQLINPITADVLKNSTRSIFFA